MTPPRGQGHFISGGMTLGQRLQAARGERGLTVEEVSVQTGVPTMGITALEEGAYERLSAAVYGRNFVRAYSQLLTLSSGEFEDLFERESRAFFSRQRMLPTFVRKDRTNRWFLRFHPKLVRIVATASVAIILASYLGFRLHAMLAQPELVLLYPTQDAVLERPVMEIEGTVSTGSSVSINGEPILSRENGEFRETVHLQQGLNVITVRAQKKFGRITEISRRVIVRS